MKAIKKDRLKHLMDVQGLNMKSLSKAAGLGDTFVRDLLERDTAPRIDSLRALADYLGTTVGYLIGEDQGTTSIVGRVGADTSGEIVYGDGHGNLGDVITPPGATASSVAVEVSGFSMGMYVDGALIFYSERQDAPTDDMLGDVVVVGLEDGRALLKRLLRGSRKGLYDLESINGPTLRDQRVSWAADVECIVPPRQAKRIRIS